MSELNTEVSRRTLLKTGASVTGGLIIGFYVPGAAGRALAQGAAAAPKEYPPNAFIQISPDNSITIIINKLEMGQGVNTSMAQLIAEELECDWTKIRSVSAPVNPVYNSTFMPTQMTGGSTALATTYMQYRQIGASCRIMLEQAAAKKWGVPVESCHAVDGFVVHAAKGKFSFGEMAEDAGKFPLPKNVTLKDPKSFRYIGKSMPRVDAAEKSNGKAIFGIDVRLPGMLYAVIARPPVVGAKLVQVVDKDARAVTGVVDVVKFGDSVAVLGKNSWAARKGRESLKLTWDFQGRDKGTNASIMAGFKAEAAKAKVIAEKRGEAGTAMKKAARKISAEYEFPYLAHACMEPMNCTINYDGEKAELWAGHQMPTFDRDATATILALPPEKITVHTVYAGGSFGRRANKNCDYVVEAAQLARIVKKPLKIQWTREDDMQGGYYRPMNYHKVEVGFDKSGKLLAWNHVLSGQSVVGGSPLEKMMVHNGVDPTVCEGVMGTPYAIDNFMCKLIMPQPNVTTLWWRSVGHTHTAYVMETMIDELAHHMKKDPLVLRQQMLRGSPRHIAVLDLLTKHAPTGKAPKGRAYGMAIHESFKSVVGQVVEASVEEGRVTVHRVVAAVHCGQVVNPEGAKAQIESAIVFGLSAALYGEIKIDNGQVATSNFSDYPVLRHNEMPEVEVHFVETQDNPTGLGEPGLPPLAPALANALFKLTGKRLRKMPFSKELQKA